MKRKIMVSQKTISTVLVELVLLLTWGYTATTMLRAPIIVLAFTWTLIRRGFKIKPDRIFFGHMLWAISFFILVIVSKKWAFEKQGIADIQNNVLWAVMVSIVVADYIVLYRVTIEEFTKLLIPVALVFMLVVVLFGTRDAESSRLSVGINANVFGIIAVYLFIFFFYTRISNRSVRNIPYTILAAVLLIFSLLAGSRKVVLALVVYFVGFLLFSERKQNTRKIFFRILITLLLLITAYALIMYVPALYNTIGNRFEALIGFVFKQEAADGSVYSRMNMMTIAGDIFSRNPILGIGANNFKYYSYYGTYAHNGYSEMMCDFGIVGLIVYYLPVLLMTIMAFRNWKAGIRDAIFPLCIFVAFFVCEIAFVSYFAGYNYCILGVGAGFSFVMSRERKPSYRAKGVITREMRYSNGI